ATMNELNLKVNISYGDSSLSEESANNLSLFVLWGVLLPLVAAAGLLGNVLTMLVLWRREMNSTTILYMRGLVITDTGILLGSVLTLTPIAYFSNVIYPVIYTPGFYFVMTLQQINVWITVSVSVERYIAICHPFRAARLISKKKTLAAMLGITLFSVLYNLPHLFATEAVSCPAAPGGQSGGCLQVTTTGFGQTEFYLSYREYMYLIIIYVLPFIALLILNSFLIRELMTMQRRATSTGSKEENEANMSLVLILIVIVFIFCQTPGLLSQFEVVPVSVFPTYLGVSNLLFATNSAVNFLIYTAFGKRFRRVLLRLFRHLYTGKGSKRRRASSASSCHAALTQYSLSNANDAVEMERLPPQYDTLVQ
ncbi:hypothetical protein EGW08_009646, partial [Elysia chlorotica]